MENLRKERLLDVIASFESKGGSDQGDYIDINGILYDIIGAMKEYCAGADGAISDADVCSIKKLIKYKAKDIDIPLLTGLVRKDIILEEDSSGISVQGDKARQFISFLVELGLMSFKFGSAPKEMPHKKDLTRNKLQGDVTVEDIKRREKVLRIISFFIEHDGESIELSGMTMNINCILRDIIDIVKDYCAYEEGSVPDEYIDSIKRILTFKINEIDKPLFISLARDAFILHEDALTIDYNGGSRTVNFVKFLRTLGLMDYKDGFIDDNKQPEANTAKPYKKHKYSEREKMLMEIWFNEANINDFLELLITAVRDYCNGSNEISKEFVEAMKKMIFMRWQFIYMDYLEKLVFDYLFRYPTDSKPAEFVGGAKAEDFIRYLAQINVLNIDTRRSVLTCTAAYQYSTDTTDTIQNHPILVWLNDGRPALDEKDYDTSGASEADTEQVESESKS